MSITRWRNIRDVQSNRRCGALRVCDQRLLQVSWNKLRAAGGVGRTRRGEAQRRERERHHAALIVAIVCNIWQDRTRLGPSVRQQPPHFSNITETEVWRDFRFRAKEFPRNLYCCAFLYDNRCRTSPFPISISGASRAGFRLPLAQTHPNFGEKVIYFCLRKKVIV